MYYPYGLSFIVRHYYAHIIIHQEDCIELPFTNRVMLFLLFLPQATQTPCLLGFL
ncbi:hypothetical protein HMPREF0083_02047 [Aneurinibacillus aneurinilyticus ATCC 12856]|uniref:Uncharacterized protein n=1 Tax=Aneurinibacillus aneurinilyticus ATCC 12856 TaxID=649747 RepID=U1X5R7_ANEAE|nr:hypothetical protein HMPREF0083_02047 [Aneurinibacillus aneurinilyticus ATCC 12856]